MPRLWEVARLSFLPWSIFAVTSFALVTIFLVASGMAVLKFLI